MNEDPKLSQRYRELPREEPPRALDDAILAASRRAVRSRRWYVPLATAAVLALAIAVTLHVQHDRPGEEVDAVSPSMQVQETPKAEAPPAVAPRKARRDERRFAPDPQPAAAPAPAPKPQAAESELASAEKRSNADVQRAPASVAAGARVASVTVERTPEAELERIAQLRAAGRHVEADKALAEFRKRYPDFRLTDEMKVKVEKR
jgi:hypothetical protein